VVVSGTPAPSLHRNLHEYFTLIKIFIQICITLWQIEFIGPQPWLCEMAFLNRPAAYKVWIFAPYLDTDDPTLKYYYDYTQSIAEYSKVFSELDCEWEWVNVTVNNIQASIEKVKKHRRKKNIVLNLCDGDEINEVPGISVIHALDASNLTYTGSDSHFYHVTTSKITMKEAFHEHGVAMPSWAKLNGHIDPDLFKKVGKPLIVKPAVSAGSMGISIKNVVSGKRQLKSVLDTMHTGFKGWKLDGAGLLAEQFIIGREFTTLLVGSYESPEQIKFYRPIERVFHQSLPEKEQFLSFERLWETYEEEKPLPDNGFLYAYQPVTCPELAARLKELSLDAFKAVKGRGYARLDFRLDKKTQQLFVLEINAQCGLSEDENYTSIGAILRVSNKTFTDLIVEVLDDALLRKSKALP
jgi:D-alanine-D-alanine ligase